jgi:hypothetical protein
MELPADAVQEDERMIFALCRSCVAYGGGVVHRAFGHS